MKIHLHFVGQFTPTHRSTNPGKEFQIPDCKKVKERKPTFDLDEVKFDILNFDENIKDTGQKL